MASVRFALRSLLAAATACLLVVVAMLAAVPTAAAEPDSRNDYWGADVARETLPIGGFGLVDPGAGIWHLRGADGGVVSFYYGDPGDVPFVGDWNCDGNDTPGLYRQSDGFVYLTNTNRQGVADIRFFFGDPGDVPLAGDFDGDGCDTVGLYRPSEGRVYIHNVLGADDGGLGRAELDYYFGDPGDKPFTGDFDGDGVDTVGLHRATTGLVYFRNSHTQGNADLQFIYGDPGDRLVAGDWNDDGMDSPAVYRPNDTTFYFRHSNSQGNADAIAFWGETDWLPVAGDFEFGMTFASYYVHLTGGPDATGACDEAFRVRRDVPAPGVLTFDQMVEARMEALLAGPTAAETAAGYSSWFSDQTAGMLNSIRWDSEVARVDFDDFSAIIPNASTSCGSAALLAQLDGTMLEAPTEWDYVVYSFNGDEDAFYNWLQRSPPGL